MCRRLPDVMDSPNAAPPSPGSPMARGTQYLHRFLCDQARLLRLPLPRPGERSLSFDLRKRSNDLEPCAGGDSPFKPKGFIVASLGAVVDQVPGQNVR